MNYMMLKHLKAQRKLIYFQINITYLNWKKQAEYFFIFKLNTPFIKYFSIKEGLDLDGFMIKFYQALKEIISNLHKSFQGIEMHFSSYDNLNVQICQEQEEKWKLQHKLTQKQTYNNHKT